MQQHSAKILSPQELEAIRNAPPHESCQDTALRLGLSYHQVYRNGHPNIKRNAASQPKIEARRRAEEAKIALAQVRFQEAEARKIEAEAKIEEVRNRPKPVMTEHRLPDVSNWGDMIGGSDAIKSILGIGDEETQILFERMLDAFKSRTLEEQVEWLQDQGQAMHLLKVFCRQLRHMWQFKPSRDTGRLFLQALQTELAYDRPQPVDQTQFSFAEMAQNIALIQKLNPNALQKMGIKPMIGFVEEPVMGFDARYDGPMIDLVPESEKSLP